MSQKAEILAVHDVDLERILRSLGVYDKVKSSHAYCRFCGRPITLDNLLGVFAEEGEVCLSCDLATCQESLAARQLAGRGGHG